MRLLAAVAFAAVTLLGGCSDDERPPAGDDCYPGLECSSVEVPQVHGAPGGPNIRLKIAVARAPVPLGRDPIVYLEGGPGGSIEAFARSGQAPAIARFFGRDFVLLEQRGNKLSEPALDCGISTAADPDVAAVQSCTRKYAQLGYRIEAFNTIENAHDIDDVRVALGVPTVTLWGGSYGGFLAQTAARLHPASISRLLLEATAMTGRAYRPFDQERARPQKLAEFLAWLTASCAESLSCSAEMPGLDAEKELTQFQERVTTAPFTLVSGAVLDSPAVVRSFLLLTLYHVPTAVLAIRLMYAANHGGLGAFDSIRVGSEPARDYLARIVTFAQVNRTSNFVYDCYDTVRNWTDAGVAEATRDLYLDQDRPAVDASIARVREVCAALPPPTVPQAELAVATSTELPVLFLHGRLDWPTPYENLLAGIDRYPNSQVVPFACSGHSISTAEPSCVTNIVGSFFNTTDLGSFDGTIDASCAETCDRSDDRTLFVER